MSCFPFIFLDFCPPPIKDTRDSTLQTNRGTPIALRTTFFFIVTVSTPAAKKCGIELPFRDGDGSPNGGGEGQEGIGAPAEGVDRMIQAALYRTTCILLLRLHFLCCRRCCWYFRVRATEVRREWPKPTRDIMRFISSHISAAVEL